MDTVLTEAEIAACVPKPPRWAVLETSEGTPTRIVANIYEFARAVEAAVLAKIHEDTERMANAVWNQLGFKQPAELMDWLRTLRRIGAEGGDLCVPGRPPIRIVPEAECRERERKAWDAALDWLDARSTHFPCCSVAPVAQSERDRRYPSLLPQTPPPLVPRTVTLSDGRKVRYARGGWEYTLNVGPDWGWSSKMFGLAVTPNDARVLASLAEQPYRDA